MAEQKPTIELEGQTYELRPMGYGLWSQLTERYRQVVRKDYLSSLLRLRTSFPADEWQAMWDKEKEEVWRLRVTPDDVRKWLDTLEGLATSFHVMMRVDDAYKFTVPQIMEILCKKADEELEKAKAARDATVPEGAGE